MGSDCCASPASVAESEPSTTSVPASAGETRGCRAPCCDGDTGAHDSKAQDRVEKTLNKSDDCCSSGECTEGKADDDADAPDCCRGKASPCCDTSCLDRLAIRECELNAAAAPGPDAQSNGECTSPKKGGQKIANPSQPAVYPPKARHAPSIVSLL